MTRVRRRAPALDLDRFAETAGSRVGETFGSESAPAEVQPAVSAQDDPNAVVQIPVSEIRPSRYQARSEAGAGIESLAQDIADNGLTHAVTVRRHPEGGYELVAGERRFRAVQHVGWASVPARVRALNELQAHRIAIAENRQRADLSKLDQARETLHFKLHLVDAGEPHTQADLSRELKIAAGVVSEELAIASAITDDVIAASGVSVADLARISHAALLVVAKMGRSEMPEGLRVAAERAAGREGKGGRNGRGKAGTRQDAFAHLWTHGGHQINLRRPVREMAAEEAEAQLQRILLGTAALSARKVEAEAPAPICVSGEHGEITYVPPSQQMGISAKRQAALLHLRRAAEVLGRDAGKEIEVLLREAMGE